MAAPNAGLIQALPKVELHLHLEGSIRPATLVELARRNSVALPAESAEEMRSWLDDVGADTFFAVFSMISRCLRSSADFELVTYELGADLAAQNVRYAEVHCNVTFQRFNGVDFDTCFAGLESGRNRVRKDFGIGLAWIFPVLRGFRGDATAWNRAADYSVSTAIEGRSGGVVALGLGGMEHEGDVGLCAPYFERALAAGLQSIPHAGEFGGAANVAAALDLLSPKRIAHGLHSVEDADLVRRLALEAVCLDVCSTSNLRLGLIKTRADHPVALLRSSGVSVSVNTDDPQVFGISLSDELGLVAGAAGWSTADLRAVQLDAVRHSCMDGPERAAVERELAAAT